MNEYKLNDIFYLDDEYSARAEWCNQGGIYHIDEIEPDEKGRRFQIVENEKMPEDELIRIRREEECFPIINRGSLWYERLTDAQKEELEEWYQAWLDAPETKVVPEKPQWLV